MSTRFAVLRIASATVFVAAWLSLPLGVRGACDPSPEDALGPYYQPSAPFTDTLASPTEPGNRLVISGQVLGGPDCSPVEAAIVEVWHASASGRYYFLEPHAETGTATFTLRGRMRTNKDGHYRFETVVPAGYDVGGGFSRMPHIHYRVTHPDYVPLVTQLYVDDERDGEYDPFGRQSRVIQLEQHDAEGGGAYYSGIFDVTLRRRPVHGR